MRVSSPWYVGLAALALVLGACKDDPSGNGMAEEDGGDSDGSVEAGPDGGPDGGDEDPDTGVDETDTGVDDPDTGTPDGGDAGPDSSIGTGTIGSLSAVNFGASPCGGDAPPAQTFSLNNTGTAPVTYTATLSGSSNFSIMGEDDGVSSGTIAPGTSVSMSINATAVPQGATAGQAITGTLTVTTNLPAPNNFFTVPISIVPQGAHLVVDPAAGADWLLVQAGQVASPLPITLRNTGNLPAEVTITQPSVDAFGLLSGTNPASALTVPAAANGTPGSVALQATFEPPVVGPFVSSAGVAVAGTVCNGGGASVTSIPFEGAATGNGFTAVASTALPPRANCGATGDAVPRATITVGNYTDTALPVALSLSKAGASPFTLNGMSMLTLTPGSTMTFDVAVLESQLPQNATPGDVLSDFVNLTPPVASGLSTISVPLTTTIQGAVLALTPPANFGGATNADPQTLDAVLTNTGNYPASPVFSIMGTDATLFAGGTLNPTAVEPGSVAAPTTARLPITFTPPVGDAAPKTASLSIAAGATDVICGDLPMAVPLTGMANTPGFAWVTPASTSTVAFGDNGYQDCAPGNAPAAVNVDPETITFKNTGNTPMDWTATLSENAPYMITPTSGTVAPAGDPLGDTASVTITPNPISFPTATTDGLYNGTITLQATNIVNDQPHPLTLALTARGAILTATRRNESFGRVNVNYSSPELELISLTNTGNLAVDVGIESQIVSPPAGSVPAYTIGSDTAIPGDPASNTVNVGTSDPVIVSGTFTPVPASAGRAPNDNDLVTTTLSSAFTTTAPVCDALPMAIDVTGTGINATFEVGGGGDLPDFCGVVGRARADDPETKVVTNYGNQPLEITGLTLASTGTADGTWFQAYIGVSGNTTATVPAAANGTPGTAVVVVAPRAIPTGTPTTPVDDILTISGTIGGVDQPDLTIDIDSAIVASQLDCP